LWVSIPALDEAISVRFVSFALATAAGIIGSSISKDDAQKMGNK
jgi:hypothetical protein